MKIRSLLIANRGEIAVRIIRACRAMGIEAVAVYSEADARALHVREADRAFLLGPAQASQSYLNIPKLIAVAKQAGVQAIHPGYGFLSENAGFARACAENGLIFVGPPADAIDLMGSKSAAKALALKLDVPTVPGYNDDDQAPSRLAEAAERIGFPLLIKASAGGGGKGMRAVHAIGDFQAALEAAQREAQSAFGDQRVLLERLIERPRHVEIQVLGDHHGNVIFLGERECSIQRRHQKVVEESPSPVLKAETRAAMGAEAVKLAQAVGYTNAGTVEFMLDQHDRFYFLEMNTRLQVEHPVTEEVTGIDLVQAQIRVAEGEPLPWTQADIVQRGHAIEVRLYAEDPVQMLPSIGRLELFEPPTGPGVRLDTGVTVGDSVSLHYDPMLAKLIVVGSNRAEAVARLCYAIEHFGVEGVQTNLPLLAVIAAHPAFAAGDTTTDFLNTHAIMEQVTHRPQLAPAAVFARLLLDLTQPADQNLPLDPWQMPWRQAHSEHSVVYIIDGAEQIAYATPLGNDQWSLRWNTHQAEWAILRHHANRIWIREGETIHHAMLVDDAGVVVDDVVYAIQRAPAPTVDSVTAKHGGDAGLQSPMPGTIIKILVEEGQSVEQGQPLLILEAMKMEHTISAPHAGTITKLPYAVGTQVTGGAALVEME